MALKIKTLIILFFILMPLKSFSTEILDQSQTKTDYGFWFDNDEIRWQEFKPTLNILSSVEVYLNINGKAGNVIIKIKDLNGNTLGSKTISESLLSSSGWYKRSFSSPINLSDGKKYRIYVYSTQDSTSATNRYAWRGSTVSSYNSSCETDVSHLWSNYDYAFKTYYPSDRYTGIIIYVDRTNTSGVETGSSDYPYNSIQKGIDAANNGDTVIVVAGVYHENIDFNQKAIIVKSESGPFSTTIKGTGIGDVVMGEGANGSTIQGFTITGGENAQDTWYKCGIDANSCNMCIRDNIITDNWGGIFTANRFGSPFIVNNLIYNNSRFAISAQFYSTPIIINNTIAYNGQDGIEYYSGTGILINNIIYKNGGYGIYCTIGSPQISNNNIYANELSNYFGCYAGTGDISQNPAFVNAEGGDFHLKDYSPCIGRGTSHSYMPNTDIEKNPRPNPENSLPDLGAFEHHASSPSKPPEIYLNRSFLFFACTISGYSPPQDFHIDNSGTGILYWTISINKPWLICTPTHGTGSGTVTVSVNTADLSAGTYIGTITVSDPDATNSPQTVSVTLTVYGSGQTSALFGSFETPLDGSTVSSSIPVTGWALDDIGVENVKIFRGNTGSLVYIGDAVFVEGARPDVEQAYPHYPMNYKAGWGYMMLTNFLPNGGNGTFKIHAIA
ncbi:MAG: right-handed parallel beta-helix repeat-containing protein, partial [Candidatus Aminicenantes bacterium]